MTISPIIEANELLGIYQDKNVMIFDASAGKDAKSHYDNEHIAGAYWVDLETQLADVPADAAMGGRHPLPTVASFCQMLTDLGVERDTHIIIYDNHHGANAAARFWWMLKAVGHERVQVLNGGLVQAKQAGILVNSLTVAGKRVSKPYQVVADWQLPTVDMPHVAVMTDSSKHLIIDVRSSERYAGISEPIDLIAGHIPNAINVPFTDNLDKDGRFLSPDVLKDKYQAIFGDICSDDIAIHCGSGVTACHTLLALGYAGMPLPSLYVGSWSEWSRNDNQMITL